MKSTFVDPSTGDVVCPVCGARNQFTVKRTAKAKWAGVMTVGVGMAALPKRLSCNGCGTNLKRGGGSAPPELKTSAPPTLAKKSPAVQARPEAPLAPTGDAAWDGLVQRASKLGLLESGGIDHRWLVRSDDRMTVAKFHVATATFSVKLKDPHVRERALALEGAVEDNVQWYVKVPHAQQSEWEGLVALAVGRKLVDPDPATEPNRVESAATSPPVGTTAAELERLAELHARGSLTDEEFAQAKARVLAASDTFESVHRQVTEDVPPPPPPPPPPGPESSGKGGKLKGYGTG